MRIFTGFDPREAVGWHAFMASLIRHGLPRDASVVPLCGEQRDGTNSFTYERFRIPEICGSGPALFVDGSDMLLRTPIKGLLDLYDKTKAVQVVKHDYRTRHPRKYVGTEMEAPNEDYPRKNWSSVILWNCGHKSHRDNAKLLRGFDGSILHRFAWLDDEEIGELPAEWNWLDEYGENENAKLVHYTNGIPGFSHYRTAPHAGEWKNAARDVLRGMA